MTSIDISSLILEYVSCQNNVVSCFWQKKPINRLNVFLLSFLKAIQVPKHFEELRFITTRPLGSL